MDWLKPYIIKNQALQWFYTNDKYMHILYEIQFKKQKTHVQKTASLCLFFGLSVRTNHGKLTPQKTSTPQSFLLSRKRLNHQSVLLGWNHWDLNFHTNEDLGQQVKARCRCFLYQPKNPRNYIQLISLIWDSFLTSCLFSNSCQNTQLCLTKEVRNESNGGCSLRMGKHDQSSGCDVWRFPICLTLATWSRFIFCFPGNKISHQPQTLPHPENWHIPLEKGFILKGMWGTIFKSASAGICKFPGRIGFPWHSYLHGTFQPDPPLP